MLEVTLSDHTLDQTMSAAAKRMAEFEAAKERFADAVLARDLKRAMLRNKSRERFRAGKYGAWLLSLFPRLLHAMSAAPRVPIMAAPSREEIVWSAGGEGEQRVSDLCSRFLSDEWIMVSGYKNRGGEIDKLLVGPDGVLAIEIKFVNGRIFCDGDRWWRDKYDNYGNLVQQDVPIADKRNRGPSSQINDATDKLQEFLSKRGVNLHISRAVILSHEKSEIGNIENQTVDLVATLDQLNAKRVFASASGGLGGCTIDRVVELIRKDHEFNARPRNTAKSTSGVR